MAVNLLEVLKVIDLGVKIDPFLSQWYAWRFSAAYSRGTHGKRAEHRFYSPERKN
jgi:hypothetical protein